ncbi:hypothetical protein F5Y17DRAFT_475857 [Xylariaceae sp. FL0594]|nr:hypothetical protein F5Y17DRAFT_475857 [Xylariaceae sp. FL0594]
MASYQINRETSVERLICRLEMTFPQAAENPKYGTGFLVNIPHLKRLCVFTAAHNIRRADEGTATSIRVRFPRIDRHGDEDKVEWTARDLGREYFVPDEWDVHTLGCGDHNWLYDWGVILGPRKDQGQWADALGFGFSIDKPEHGGTIHVHGFPENRDDLEGGELYNRLEGKRRITYDINTIPGMSGGPAWMNLNHGNSHLPTAVGIHNYLGKATRLTFVILRRIFEWLKPHLENGSPTRLNAKVSAEIQSCTLQLIKITPTEAATAFLEDIGTRFDILPVHIPPNDGKPKEGKPKEGEPGEGDYLYALSVPVSPPSGSEPVYSFLQPGEVHSKEGAPRSVGFKGVPNKECMFHIQPKGATGRFQIFTKDNSWYLSMELPANIKPFTDADCGDMTPVAPTARFIKTGQARVRTVATAFSFLLAR